MQTGHYLGGRRPRATLITSTNSFAKAIVISAQQGHTVSWIIQLFNFMVLSPAPGKPFYVHVHSRARTTHTADFYPSGC